MSPQQIGYITGGSVGGVFGILILYAILQKAILPDNRTTTQKLWVVFLAGITAIGLASFGDGEGGFLNRILNVPNILQSISYAIATAIVMAIIVFRDKGLPPKKEETKSSSYGRIAAIAISLPILALSLGSLIGGVYSASKHGLPGQRLGVSQASMREIMLNGDMNRAGFAGG